MKTRQQSELEFEHNLNNLILKLRERAEKQFKYNLETNIPDKISGLNYDNAAEHALEIAIVGASNAMTGWDCNKAIRRAYSVMEDANAHREAKELIKFIPEYQ